MKNRIVRFHRLLRQDHGKRWRIMLTSSAASAVTGMVLEYIIRKPVNVSAAFAAMVGIIILGLQVLTYINLSE
jgi:hypothetical protein